MEESREFTGKNVEEALSSALSELNVTEDQIEYEVVEKESNGFLGLFNNKPAKIIVKLKKKDICSVATGFINEVLSAMGVKADVKASLTESNDEIDIDLEGDEMGVLIGKRGATLDSLQYLTSLVVNKESDSYIKVKMDTENYRARRKETLENLAKEYRKQGKEDKT